MKKYFLWDRTDCFLNSCHCLRSVIFEVEDVGYSFCAVLVDQFTWIGDKGLSPAFARVSISTNTQG